MFFENPLTKKIRLINLKYILILSLLIFFMLPANAAQLAASVILSKGSVMAVAEDGSKRILKRRSKIFSGDIINTGKKGSVQLRFIDKALMTIKANSSMNISSYVLGSSEQKEQVVMRLVKGGFRTITGAIGKGDKSAYLVYTPAASVGIRGTNYEVQQESSGSFVMAVYSGGISVTNEAGSIELGLGSGFNFTRVTPGQAPKGLLLSPASLSVNNADEQEEEDDSSDTENEDTENEGEGEGEGEESDADQESSSAEAGLDDGSQTADTSSAVEKKLTEKIVDGASDTLNMQEETADLSHPFPPPYNSPEALVVNPFDHNIISNDEWNLLLSKQFGSLHMGLDYSLNADGLPSFVAELSSPNPITVNNFIPFDYSASGQGTNFYLDYTVLDTQNNTTTGVTSYIYIDVDISSPQDLLDQLNAELELNEVSIEAVLVSGIHGDRFVFRPININNEFIIDIILEFNNSGNIPDEQFMVQMGADSSLDVPDWEWYFNDFLSIADGSWDEETDSPIFGFSTITEGSEGEHELSYAEAASGNVGQTVDNFDEFKACADNNEVCDIHVASVAASNNIRWGAWLARPGNGVTFSTFSSGSAESYVDETNLSFGLIAERADINQLVGVAHFSSVGHTDCSDYSQCLGFADDGIVKHVSGKFDVDFNNGAITNGSLNIETMDVHNNMLSNWSVNFDGQMAIGSDQRLVEPEFYTDSLSGTVHDSATGITSNAVQGTVGGIFVNPGNVFAGGYNLGTTDGTNKHAAGLFTLEE